MIKPILTNNINANHNNFLGKNPLPLFKNKNNFLQQKKADTFLFENIKSYTTSQDLNNLRIDYIKPQTIIKAFENLLTTQISEITMKLEDLFHCVHELKTIYTDLVKNPKIGNIKVKSLLNIGCFAYAFETADGKVLKISPRNHFPDNREPQDFDVPIYEKGKLNNRTYYYIEEKLFQDNVTVDEIRAFCEYIESKGFKTNDVWPVKQSLRQFGKDANGKLFLLDPGCACIQKEHLPIFKRLIKNLRDWLRK